MMVYEQKEAILVKKLKFIDLIIKLRIWMLFWLKTIGENYVGDNDFRFRVKQGFSFKD